MFVTLYLIIYTVSIAYKCYIKLTGLMSQKKAGLMGNFEKK